MGLNREDAKGAKKTQREARCALECGGKRQRDPAFGGDFRRAAAVGCKRRCRALRASEGGVALTLPAAVQGARIREWTPRARRGTFAAL